MKNLTTKLLLAGVSAAVFMTACSDSASEKAVKVIKKAPTADSALANVKSVDAASIVAKKTSEKLGDISPESSLWEDAAFSNVVVYPQTTISFNDKKSIELNKNNGAKTAKVAAYYNDSEIAIAVTWEDKSENTFQGGSTDTYADGVAIQVAKNPSATLPYIGMGSEGREVAIYLQKVQFNTFEPNGKGNVDLQVNRDQTNLFDQFGTKDLSNFDASVAKVGSDDYEKVFVSAGFRSMTEVKDGSSKSNMKISRIEGYGWIATLVRPLKDGLADLSKSFPIALALWDGDKNNRNGLKLLSGWNAVTLGAANDALVKTINETVKGDIKNGKEQAEMNCGSCHKFPGSAAMDYMAPDLSNIGGYATAAYIKESMLQPNAVIVPGYNRNAHTNTPWYNIENGKRVSTMPAFDYLDEKSLNDMIAYFQTLKAKGE